MHYRLGRGLSHLQGDWKLGGLGLTIPLKRPDGSSTEWEFPSNDNRMPPFAQRSFDYIGM
jgi:SCY1-like protein 2